METTAAVKQPVPADNETFFADLYEGAFPAFAQFAARLNGSFDDAKDIFHDALVVFFEKSMQPDFRVTGAPEPYVVGIAKHLWIRKFHHDRLKISLNDVESSIAIPSDFYPEVNELRLLRLLETTGKRCLELLQKFYYERSPLKDIARTLGYGNEHSASVQKFKCLGKMREAIKSNGMSYDDFLS